ncbi:hypothetical protein Col01nite_32820 [Cellulomonas oligotrophica]|uniref:Uncharacterized protein n=1 Tax=Cellulomonas oligotrophica TaxID=931536 RepID=A0ABQ4DEH1_9CELL|nr:hypothetical protein Col01nite_32820 [Cellulomonas oligotrophica]
MRDERVEAREDLAQIRLIVACERGRHRDDRDVDVGKVHTVVDRPVPSSRQGRDQSLRRDVVKVGLAAQQSFVTPRVDLYTRDRQTCVDGSQCER